LRYCNFNSLTGDMVNLLVFHYCTPQNL